MRKLLIIWLLLIGCQTTRVASYVTADGATFYTVTCSSTLTKDRHWGDCYEAAAEQCEDGFGSMQHTVSNTHVFNNENLVILISRSLTFRCMGN